MPWLNLTLDIVLTLGSVAENVIVSGDSPLLETQKPIQAVNIAGDFQRLLPLSTRRDLTDALEVSPGVTTRNLAANNGTQTYMLGGMDVEQHVVQIDGADMVSSRQGRMENSWFFASYFFLHRNSQISGTPTQLNNLRASIPGGNRSTIESTARDAVRVLDASRTRVDVAISQGDRRDQGKYISLISLISL